MKRRQFITIVGAAASWPFRTFAQPSPSQPRPTIAYLNARSEQSDAPFVAAFRRGLGEQGLLEGDNIHVEYRWADNDQTRVAPLALELVGRKPAVIVMGGGALATLTVKKLTSSIPIVFITGADPIAVGLVTSLSRPAGNLTGISFLATQIVTKRLDLLHEFVPNARGIAVLINPNNPDRVQMSRDLEQAERVVKFPLKTFRASSEDEIERAFAEMATQNVDALLIGGDNYFNAMRRKIIALAMRQSLPSMFDFREFAADGGLMSYGASQTEAYRQGAVYVARILGGAKTADLPVIQATRFELVINRTTAKALRLEIPTKLMALADELIE
jgi:putative ABC transport system substrate-binding protein